MHSTAAALTCPLCHRALPDLPCVCPGCGYDPEAEPPTQPIDSPLVRAPALASLETRSDPPPQPRSLLEGRYEILDELGRGGMGVVYRAHDRQLDEVIALKTLSAAAKRNPQFIERFKHEVKVARRLTHPNIARLHDLVEVSGELYLSMEFIPGRPLSELLNDGPLQPKRVVEHLRQLLRAIEVAHLNGIVHRDLKPANIIIDDHDVPHILDFGIARSRWLKTTETMTSGTPRYMAPEQWTEGRSGVPVDGRADLYSLGVVAFEMLCGRPPFDHPDRLMLMKMHCSHPPERPGHLVRGIPAETEAAVMRLLEKDPVARYQNAAEALQALAEPKAPSGGGGRVHVRGEAPPMAPQPPRVGPPLVLVADADAVARAALVHALSEHGLEVLATGSGELALQLFQTRCPDLIILDFDLPVIDGLNALQIIKRVPRGRLTPVIITTTRLDDEQAACAKELGASTCLSKPISGSMLDLMVEPLLARAAG